MSPLLQAILAALVVSLISFLGVATLLIKRQVLDKIIFLLISFSAGALLGSAYFHLLPEALAGFRDPIKIFSLALVGFSVFFILERVLRWRHCHEADCEVHKHLGYLSLVGDSFHNLIDGLVIFSAFIVSPALGIAVTASMALHEIPQELGDFGVLLYAGFSRARALFYNFISASVAILGVILGYILINFVQNLNDFLLPFAAGGFIYIASSDLIPELHKEKGLAKSLLAFVVFILALVLFFFLKHD